MTELPDLIVMRHRLDIPPDQWARDLEGMWIDRSKVRPGRLFDPYLGYAVAEPTGRFEVRDGDGAVAEVWEIRKLTPEERGRR